MISPAKLFPASDPGSIPAEELGAICHSLKL